MNNTQKTQELLEKWDNVIRQKAALEEKIWRATEALHDVEAELAKHLAPEDMKNGEQIGIWINVERLGDPKKERLLNVKKCPPRSGENVSYYEVKFR